MNKATAPDLRKRELAQIHIARQQLGMDDDTYRAMLWTVARVKSAADLDWAGRKQVLDHCKAKGWKNTARHRPAPAKSKAALVAKIRALLIAAGNRPDAYADGMARRMFGLARFDWCTHQQLGKLIAALAIDGRRTASTVEKEEVK
ncbi:MAG: gp16 family protein [Sulfuriferula sp.]